MTHLEEKVYNLYANLEAWKSMQSAQIAKLVERIEKLERELAAVKLYGGEF